MFVAEQSTSSVKTSVPSARNSLHTWQKTFHVSPMADSVEQSKWGKFIGETTAITIARAVLYFWGRIYTNQLVRSSGFPGDLFDISIYDVLMFPWVTVFLGAMYAVAAISIWYARYVWGTFIFWVLATVLAPVAWLVRLIPDRWIQKIPRPNFNWCDRYLAWLKQRTPDGFLEKAKGTDESILFKCSAAIAVIFLIFLGGYQLEKEAKKKFEELSTSTTKRNVKLLHQDGKETPGQLVCSLGGSLILDVPTSTDSLARILVRSADIKQVTQLPPPAPKEPSISAAPVAK